MTDTQATAVTTSIVVDTPVEKAFAIRFHVGEVERVQNVGEFADLIAKRIQSR